jgi:hypothetical protein
MPAMRISKVDYTVNETGGIGSVGLLSLEPPRLLVCVID